MPSYLKSKQRAQLMEVESKASGGPAPPDSAEDGAGRAESG